MVRLELPLPGARDRSRTPSSTSRASASSSEVAEAKAAGFTTRPVIVGPVTLLLLSKPADGVAADFQPLSKLEQLLPVYVELLGEAGGGGRGVGPARRARPGQRVDRDRRAARCWRPCRPPTRSSGSERPLGILVAAPYGALEDALPVLEAAPIDAIALDLVRGALPTGPATDKVLVGGVIDGHNIWRGDLEAAFGKLEALKPSRRTSPSRRPRTCSTPRTTWTTSPTCPTS